MPIAIRAQTASVARRLTRIRCRYSSSLSRSCDDCTETGPTGAGVLGGREKSSRPRDDAITSDMFISAFWRKLYKNVQNQYVTISTICRPLIVYIFYVT